MSPQEAAPRQKQHMRRVTGTRELKPDTLESTLRPKGPGV